ncbi:MAG: hypothetical protein RI897_2520 [Verrucomicrobiota bacterium]
MVEEVFEQAHAVLDGFGGGHIDACVGEHVEGVVAVAGFEELHPAFFAAFLVLDDLFGDGGCGAVAGGVAIDVVIAVVVGDTEAFHIQFGVDGEIGTEVADIDLVVYVHERFGGHGFALFCERMGGEVEF